MGDIRNRNQNAFSQEVVSPVNRKPPRFYLIETISGFPQLSSHVASQIDEDRPRVELVLSHVHHVDVGPLELQVRVALKIPVGVDAVLVGHDLPELGAHLKLSHLTTLEGIFRSNK